MLLDDRDCRAGVKFKDADLIGVPLRVVIGERGLKEGKLEVKWRWEKEAELIEVKGASQRIAAWWLRNTRRTRGSGHGAERCEWEPRMRQWWKTRESQIART